MLIYIRSSPVINKRRQIENININHEHTIDALLVDGYIQRQSFLYDIFEYKVIKFSIIYGWRFYDGQICIK